MRVRSVLALDDQDDSYSAGSLCCSVFRTRGFRTTSACALYVLQLAYEELDELQYLTHLTRCVLAEHRETDSERADDNLGGVVSLLEFGFTADVVLSGADKVGDDLGRHLSELLGETTEFVDLVEEDEGLAEKLLVQE